MRAVVLVEGDSDRIAVLTIARRRGHDLHTAGVSVVAMGGATNIRRYLERFGPQGCDLPVAGLYDLAEEPFFVRALSRAGGATVDTTATLAARGFFVCHRDLEDELIRAVGAPRVLEVVEAEAELGSFRLLQSQPAHRDACVHDQLHRFIGTKSGRKARYSRLLAEAVPWDRVPRPLSRVLTHAYRSMDRS